MTEHQAHVAAAMKAREFMNSCIEQARSALIAEYSLGKHVCMSGPDVAHYSFDYAQQVCC